MGGKGRRKGFVPRNPVPFCLAASYNSRMEIVHLTGHTDAEGRLLIDAATPIKDRDVEVTVTPKALNPWDGVPRDELGYPLGFKEHFFGAFPDAPEDPEELPLNEPRL